MEKHRYKSQRASSASKYCGSLSHGSFVFNDINFTTWFTRFDIQQVNGAPHRAFKEDQANEGFCGFISDISMMAMLRVHKNSGTHNCRGAFFENPTAWRGGAQPGRAHAKSEIEAVPRLAERSNQGWPQNGRTDEDWGLDLTVSEKSADTLLSIVALLFIAAAAVLWGAMLVRIISWACELMTSFTGWQAWLRH